MCQDLPVDVKANYKFGGTPQTLVVSADGHVIKNWTGAYSGSLKTEIEGFFQIELPGLTELNFKSNSH